jgi:archaellum biogenesis ATPase FlaH
MNLEKQRLLISYLMSDGDLFARCNTILDPNYFDPEVRHSVHFLKEFYDGYRALPTADQISAETGNFFAARPLTKSEIEYGLKEVETYCRNKAIEKAILSSPKLLEKEDFNTILANMKDAISVSINRELGLDYFDNPEERLLRMLQTSAVMPTGYKELDLNLNGGISRKELLLFMAGSGVGKSIMMSNLAINFLFQKLNVVYITLELAEPVVAKRFDTMITGVSQREIFEKMSKVQADLEQLQPQMGKLFIKRMPESTTNANHIRAYLKEFEMAHGFLPDVIVLDYMDLMTSNQKISAENLFVKDKYVAEELRSIANEYNLLMVSASQMNRSAIGADDIDQSNIAGGLSKINTCDNLIAIIQTEAMKAAGEYMLKLVKTRNSGGVGKVLMLRWNPVSLRVTDLDFAQKDKIQFVKADDEKKKKEKKSVLDLMNV